MTDHQTINREVVIEIPELFELANVAIAISDAGLKHPNRVHKRGPYYERVLEHFQSRPTPH